MTNKNNDAYRNTPQFETNQALNKDMTPDVPKFNSNAMDNQGFMPLNNCSCGCHCNHDKDTINIPIINIVIVTTNN